jgi:hypothetical protein
LTYNFYETIVNKSRGDDGHEIGIGIAHGFAALRTIGFECRFD